MVLINCCDVCLKYGNTIVVENFSYSFKLGHFVCLVGQNGCGKSTLLSGILKLKYLYYGRVDYVNLNKNEIGFMPQKLNLKTDFPASVFEVVLSGFCGNLNFFNFYSRNQKQKVLEILRILELENLRNKSFKELSKGQQQRVLFARSICSAKKILFLDEPCANLDPIYSAKIYEIIKILNEKKNIAVVMVTHDLNKIVQIPNLEIIHIQKHTLFKGLASDYFKSSVGRNFLGGLKIVQ